MNFKDSSSPAHFEWVKMLVSDGKKAAWHTESPGYRTLGKSSGGTLFAFKRIVGLEPIPNHLEACNDFEINKLEKMEEEKWGIRS